MNSFILLVFFLYSTIALSSIDPEDTPYDIVAGGNMELGSFVYGGTKEETHAFSKSFHKLVAFRNSFDLSHYYQFSEKEEGSDHEILASTSYSYFLWPFLGPFARASYFESTIKGIKYRRSYSTGFRLDFDVFRFELGGQRDIERTDRLRNIYSAFASTKMEMHFDQVLIDFCASYARSFNYNKERYSLEPSVAVHLTKRLNFKWALNYRADISRDYIMTTSLMWKF